MIYHFSQNLAWHCNATGEYIHLGRPALSVPQAFLFLIFVFQENEAERICERREKGVALGLPRR
jgi:hypothetical protein